MKKFKQIGAWIVIGILLSLYLVCFIAAVSGREELQLLFKFSLVMTVVLPVLLYVFILFLKMAQEKKIRIPEPEKEEEDSQEDSRRDF